MIKIRELSIQNAFDKINRYSDRELEASSEKYISRQPILFGYLFHSAKDFNNDKVLELLVRYFNIFLEAVELQDVQLKRLEHEDIDIFYDEYVNVLKETEETEDDVHMKAFTGQSVLFNYLQNDLQSSGISKEVLDDNVISMTNVVCVALLALINRAIIGENER